MVLWLSKHWVACALVMGIFLLLLAPLLSFSWSLSLLLIFLQLPIYMLHQVEEHAGDRFRTFVNKNVFGGYEALTPEAILVINLPGVWGVNLAGLYAAAFLGAGWGLCGMYLTVVNGITHVVGAIATRKYNPGLWTSIGLFLPIGGLALWIVGRSPQVTTTQQLTGLIAALLIHAAIVLYAKARVRALKAEPDRQAISAQV